MTTITPVRDVPQRALSDAARANVEVGVLLLCKECLVTAIADRRLDRGHLRVLAAMIRFVNGATARAWPDRRTIAAALGIEPVTVSNKIRDLRAWGYLIAARERVPEANNRSLTVYTLGNIDHETIRREIETYIDQIKGAVTEASDFRKSPPSVTVTEGGDFGGAKVTGGSARKSPPAVDSNSEMELVESGALARDVPHMGSDGFVISARYNIVIPAETVSAWRTRFPAIADLDAKLEKLASVILARGSEHPGWRHPASWMAGCLGEDNAKARPTGARATVNSSVDHAFLVGDALMVRLGTPQHQSWVEHYRRKGSPSAARHAATHDLQVPSEWPPEAAPAEEHAA